MGSRFLTAVAASLAVAGLARAQLPAVADKPAKPAVAGAATDSTTAGPAPVDAAIVDNAEGSGPVLMEGLDGRPWNPPVRESNLWPYGKQPPCWKDVIPGYVGEFWAGAEYWQGAIKGTGLPALPLAGIAATATLADSKVDYGPFSGGRFTGGVFSNCWNTIGFEGSYFYLAERTVSFTTDGTGVALLGIAPPLPGVGLVLDATAAFQGADATIVWQAYCSPGCGLKCTTGCVSGWRLEVLGGFRWLDLSEEWLLHSNLLTPFGGFVPAGSLGVGSEFAAHNRFLGGQFGARAEFHRGRLLGTLTGKLGFGANSQEIRYNSGQLVLAPFDDGPYEHTAFSVVPEIGARLGYQLTTNARVFAGYDLLFWSNVVRVGDQLDPLPPSADARRPDFPARQADFWVQAGTFGVEFRY